jgi:carboxyl-terminal processing protease
MRRQLIFGARFLLLAFCSNLIPAMSARAATDTNRVFFHLTPGPEDGRIAFFTARLLEQYHYSHHPFDDGIASEFLDRYLETLDPQHLHFLQSDLAQFARFRTNLDNLTLTRRGVANTTPAYEIFNRFFERLQQRAACVDEWLKTDKFEFNTDDRIAVDRRDADYPRNLDEAKELWHQRLRFEYLQEKLGLDSKREKAAANHETNSVASAKSDREQIVDTLTHRYQRTLHMFKDWDNEDVMGIYLTALANVYDPHSDYFNKAALEGFKISMNLQLFGIGAELRSTPEDGYCKIERLLPGGPAIKSKKIKVGDRIIAVAQGDEKPVDIVDMSLSKAVQLIRGPKGTEVRLTIIPDGSSEHKVVTLVRDEIPLDDQAAKGKIIDLPNAKGNTTRLGVIDLPSFYAPMDMGSPQASADGAASQDRAYTSVDVAKLLNKFKEENVKGVILDLRFNGGGSLEEAIRLTGLFIKKGPVVQVRDLDGSVKVDKDNDPSVVWDGPLIVLVNRFSASASEIVAGALQDYGRALIVGDTSTHGKGTVQTVSLFSQLARFGDADPDEAGALKFTIRKFYRASGASTQLKGVMPDIVLPSEWNYAKDIGESSLEHPMPWDTIASADYQKLGLVQPYLGELLRRSNQRVSTNEDFAFVRQEIELFRKQQADKTISLNEKKRLAENEEAEQRKKAREAELRARKDSDDKVYEISLKQAELPGLPPPVQKTNSIVSATLPNDSRAITNSVSLVKLDATEITAPDDDADTDDKVTAPDVNLNEAEQIMLDYLPMFPKKVQVVDASK